MSTAVARYRASRLRITASRDGLVFVGAAYCALACYVVIAGMPVLHLLSATLTVAVLQVLPGVLLWRAMRPRDGWMIEDLACGFALGFCLSIPAQLAGGLLDSPVPGILFPLIVAGLLIVIPATRHRIRTASCTPTPGWLGAVISLSTAAALPKLIAYVRQNPTGWSSGYRSPHVDQYFQLSMVKEMLHRGPVEWPLVAGEGMDYHWFAHAWMAHVAAGSYATPEEILFRFAPILSPFLVVVSVAALALRISARPAVAAFAVLLTVVGGVASFWNATDPAAPLNPESPTLALSVPALLALTAMLAMRWRGQDVRWSIPAIFGLAVVASGTKGSSTPLVIAGTALAVVAMFIWRRRVFRVAVVDLLVLLTALVFTVKVVFNGSADALSFNPRLAMHDAWPVQTTRSGRTSVLLLGGATMLLAGFSRALPGCAALLRRAKVAGNRDPVQWMLVGSAFAGAFAPLLFVQPGKSQYYFRISAIPLAATASAVALGALWQRSVRGAIIAAVAVVGGIAAWRLPTSLITVRAQHPGTMIKVLAIGTAVLLVVALVAALFARSHRVLVAVTAVTGAVLVTGVAGSLRGAIKPIPPAPHNLSAKSAGAVGAGEVEASRYIGAHSGVNDVVMTNRHCRTNGKICDSRYFMVSATSGRQMLVEGWGYTPTISARYPQGRTSITAPFWNPSLLRLNDDFYTAPTAQAAQELWGQGVRWVFVDTSRPHDSSALEHYATLRYQNSQAQAWQLSAPAEENR